MYDKERKDGFWFLDENNVFTSLQWDDRTLSKMHDSCETSWEAYYSYGDEDLLKSLRNCIKRVDRTGWKKIFGKYYYQLQRYPITYDGMIGMSRDHLIYMFAAFVTANFDKKELNEWTSHFRPVVSTTIGMHMTPELWLWLKLISGKPIGYLYYPFRLLFSTWTMLWVKFIYKIAQWPEEWTWEEYKERNGYYLSKNKSKKDKFFSSIIGPVFSRKLTSTKVSVLPNNWFTRSIKWLELQTTTKQNFTLRLLNGDRTVTKEEVEGIHSIMGHQSSTSFEPWRTRRWRAEIPKDRGYKVTNEEHINQLDRDYALKLWEKLNS